VIARVWKGWTRLENADAYENFLRSSILLGLQSIDGFRGMYIMRQDGTGETEFVVMNLFETLDAVTAVAGPEYETPVIEPEARALLSKFEPIAHHYDVKQTP